MTFEEQNCGVHYDPNDARYRVYWRGRLMRPTFSTRLAALGYLGALRNGLRKPDFAEQTPALEKREGDRITLVDKFSVP
jgi:hypothetical protein